MKESVALPVVLEHLGPAILVEAAVVGGVDSVVVLLLSGAGSAACGCMRGSSCRLDEARASQCYNRS